VLKHVFGEGGGRRVIRVALALPVFLWAAGCTLAGPPAAAGPLVPSPVVDAPALTEGSSTPAQDRRAAEQLTEAEARLNSGDAAGALELAREVALALPMARGSSRALWVQARAEAALGRWSEAQTAADQYVLRVPSSDAFSAGARLLSIEARFQLGRSGAFEALWDVSPSSPSGLRDGALALARVWIERLEDPALRDLIAEAPTHPWLTPVALTEFATRRFLVGDGAAAQASATEALALSPDATERSTLSQILDGTLPRPTGIVQGVVGAILSSSGPPSFQALSRDLQDGIELALMAEGIRGGVRLELADDAGTAGRAGGAWAQVEGGRPFALIGPLTESTLAEVVRLRQSAVPILSPTARLVPEGARRVFTLSGPDPEAMRVLATMVLGSGVREVILIHTADPEEDLEAEWFKARFEAGGGRILRTLTYPSGSLNLDAPLATAGAARPQGVVLLAPPEDVERLAPLLPFHGLDPSAAGARTLVFGNASWASIPVLEAVSPRFLEGIRTVTPHVGEGYGPEWDRFRVLYEAQFQRTLRTPFPALGWDAAQLLFQAAASVGATPDEVARGLERIAEFSGATGVFTYQEGRLTRRYYPVRIESGARVPLMNPDRR
jgi:ABC-type branched-subunit amino acid transport system substrate-binding protein